MVDTNRYELWKQKQKTELQKNLQQRDLSKEDRQELFAQVQLSMGAADITMRYLETAREIGATIFPTGTASNVIEIAEMLHQIERDIIDDSRDGEPDPGEPDDHTREE